MKRQRAYLAGKMSGVPDLNFPAFHAAAAALREFYDVFNPAETFDGDTTKPRAVYMRVDIAALLECDLIALLPGWEFSEGAKLERDVAKACGIPAYTLRMDVGGHVWSLTPLDAGEVLYLSAPMPIPPGETVLEEAQRIVYGDRQKSYGHPLDNHTCTATMLRAWVLRRFGVDVPFDAESVCWFNILQKTSREANLPKRDNAVDVSGFAANAIMVSEERKRRGQ